MKSTDARRTLRFKKTPLGLIANIGNGSRTLQLRDASAGRGAIMVVGDRISF
jgi:hypothetical protein